MEGLIHGVAWISLTFVFATGSIFFLLFKKTPAEAPMRRPRLLLHNQEDDGTARCLRESCDWLNHIGAYVIKSVIQTTTSSEIVYNLSNLVPQQNIRFHVITSSLGAAVPKIVSVITRPSEPPGTLEVEAQYASDDSFCVMGTAELPLDYPATGFAALPIEFSVSKLKFFVHLRLEQVPNSPGEFVFQLLTVPTWDAVIETRIGAKYRIVNSTKIEKLVRHSLHQLLCAVVVTPNFVKCKVF